MSRELRSATATTAAALALAAPAAADDPASRHSERRQQPGAGPADLGLLQDTGA